SRTVGRSDSRSVTPDERKGSDRSDLRTDRPTDRLTDSSDPPTDRPGLSDRLTLHFPWVLPFAVFLVLLGLMPRLGLHPAADQAVRIGVVGSILLTVSRPVIDLKMQRWVVSVAVGLVV